MQYKSLLGSHYSESQKARSCNKQALLAGLKKAKALGIEDMTEKEAEEYLKKKEEREKK